ncbi:hypothetical protein CVT25_015339 [Psilocybe cyanescens]|uniref:Terpene synthase n=1 Tax=Psilocybe cyanescens TaxID=93625 RepID=A0A409WH47_PSICY|nr:hypothetical protein CVT25_015339 [Psilocybe cyanescens]
MEFRLPELHRNWPFPRLENPFFKEGNQLSREWFDSHQLFNEVMQHKFREIKSGTLAAFAYPNLSKDHFRVACDLMNILFAMDDISDHLNVTDIRSLAIAALDGLRNPDSPLKFQEQHRMRAVHMSFWKNASKIASNTVKRRFVKSYDAYVNAVVQEAMERRERQVRPSLEEYLTLRRSTGAIKPSLDLIMLPLEISDEYLELDSVKELELIAIDLIAIANDIVSFNVEQARGDIHNAVIVLMEKQKLSIQEAMDFVDEWYQRRSSKFIDIMKEMEETLDESDRMQRDLKIYIKGLAQWVTANYEWSFETSRFFGPHHKDIYKARAVALMPKRGKGKNINSAVSNF